MDRRAGALLGPGRGLDKAVFAPSPTKIFGVGLGRTGTTSLLEALKLLGILGIHHAPYLFPAMKQEVRTLDSVAEYDAFIDSPFSFFYRDLDAAFPGSKFIYTRRPLESWLQSLEWLIGDSSTGLSRWFYGTDRFDATCYRQRFLRHESEVLEYFRNRPSDLLVLDVFAGDGWDVLCPFLGKSEPQVAFPAANRRTGTASPLAQRKVHLP